MKQAVASPLLETTIEGASHVIINISGDISLMDANDAASYVQEMAGENANIIFGAMYDDTYADEATITVIATGLTDMTLEEPKKTTKTTANKRIVPEFSQPTANVQPMKMPNFGSMNTSAPSMQSNTGRLKAPESKVQERDIQIPDFLKRR